MSSKIQLGAYGYLDVEEDVSVPLNFSLSEIQDISKRSGNYSKTIKLAGTQNNKNLLANIFNVNITDGSFDVNTKRDVTILRNGTPQFEGFMQLLAVNKKSPTHPGMDEQVSFEVQVKDKLVDFYSMLKDGVLDTLTAFTQSSHTLTMANVMKTSAFTNTEGYKYFLPYKDSGTSGQTVYTLTDFNLAIAAKKYWDAIWSEAGYSYDWPQLTATSFHKCFIPYNGETQRRNIPAYSFKSSISADTATIGMGRLVRLYTLFDWYELNTSYSQIPVPFNDDSSSNTTGVLFDSGNTFNTSAYTYTSDIYGVQNFFTKFKCEVYLENDQAYDVQPIDVGTTTPSPYHFELRGQMSAVTGGVTTPIYDELIYEDSPSGTYITANSETLIGTFTCTEMATAATLSVGSEVSVSIAADNYSMGANVRWVEQPAQRQLASNEYPILKIKFIPITGGSVDYRTTYFYNKPVEFVNEGETIELTNYIPKNIKRKDFVSSICKMFNLYITPTDNQKIFKIETRDEFYDNGEVKDWTRKLASEQEQVLKFLPDLTAEKYLFTYKQGKDLFSTAYNTATGEVYGQLDYTFANDFVKDTNKIELIFQSVPLVENGSGQIVPSIPALTPSTEISILYDGGSISSYLNKPWYFSASSTPTVVDSFSLYPYMGHYNHPLSPSIDLNFGENDYLFYNTWIYLTDNNLYNKYYSRFVNQIESGKMLTAWFRLNELDILNFNPRDRIYVADTYYYVNKIIDYDANSKNGLTKVELITIDEGHKFTATVTQRNPNQPQLTPDEGDLSEE